MRLKQLRKNRGLYQKNVAEMLGIDRTTYGKYETGDSEPPIEYLIKLADYYNVTIDFLVGRVDDMLPKVNLVFDEEKSLSPEEHKLIEDFRRINSQGKDYVLQSLAMALKIYEKCNIISKLEGEKVT